MSIETNKALIISQIPFGKQVCFIWSTFSYTFNTAKRARLSKVWRNYISGKKKCDANFGNI